MKFNSLEIEKPTLLVNEKTAKKNIKTMAEKAEKSGVRFRPHFKTHQSAGVGEWFRDFGVNAITVSSIEMAEYFADNGWDDITIAFPLNLREIYKINKLAAKIRVSILIESLEILSEIKQKLNSRVSVWIKVDTGYKRTGIQWDNEYYIKEIVKSMENIDKINLEGFLAHAGHTYHVKSRDEVRSIYHDTLDKLRKVKKYVFDLSKNDLEISIGDTPGCSIVNDFSGVDEIRPGNFVFYDSMQMNIGSCTEDEIAVAVACPVVAKHYIRNEIVIYCGAAHLSNDVLHLNEKDKIYGCVALPDVQGWSKILSNTYVKSLSQEHGILKTDKNTMRSINLGDIIVIIPVHSCLAVNLLRTLLTIDGKKITTMKV